MNDTLILEIEKKFKIDPDKKKVFEEKIVENGGRFIKKLKEKDVYFIIPGRNSVASKECLRIRESDEKKEITYKGPTQIGSEKEHYSKSEINVNIENPSEAIGLLKIIGNTVYSTVEKEREYFEIEGCNVVFDLVKGAGLYMEIETFSEDSEAGLKKLGEIAKMIGLENEEPEILPYRDIVKGGE